jgi:hypothetical protein
MRTPLLVGLSAVLIAAAFGSCVVESTTPSTGGSGVGGSGSGGAGGGIGGSDAGTTGGNTTIIPDSGAKAHCVIDDGTDPYLQCTQKLVLAAEHASGFLPKLGVAESWDSTTLAPDTDTQGHVIHVAGDDAAYGASIARYMVCAEFYGDSQITWEMADDLIALQPLLVAEFKCATGQPCADGGVSLPQSYAGELYFDLRVAAGGLRGVSQAALADAIDKGIADPYGRAIYASFFKQVPVGDGGVGGGILGVPVSGGGVAYSTADAATGAYALADLAVAHATDDPIAAGLWQAASASVFSYLAARARDPNTHLFYAALVTSGDPGHDALAPAAPSGPPADALLTEVNARAILALERTQALVTAHQGLLPNLEAVQLQPLADALVSALQPTGGAPDASASFSLWDSALGGYYAGWVPSTSTLLTDKPFRANALMLAALSRGTLQGTPPDGTNIGTLKTLLSSMMADNSSFLTVIGSQNSYFQDTSATFTFPSTASTTDPRPKSYFAAANAVAIEAMNEGLYKLPP